LPQTNLRLWHRRSDSASNSYDCFFLRSAQRFFIISDKRFLPAGVSPRRLGLVEEEAAVVEPGRRPLRALVAPDCSSSPMALPILSISCLNSATIFSRSNIVASG
jgi:hypothetical protein